MPRSRNVRLTSIQRDILWAIEETGADDLWTVWITVRASHDSMPGDQFWVEFVDGLFGLSRLRYVRLVRHLPGSAGTHTEAPREQLERLWVGEIRDVGNYVEVEMTAAGYEALGEPGGTRAR